MIVFRQAWRTMGRAAAIVALSLMAIVALYLAAIAALPAALSCLTAGDLWVGDREDFSYRERFQMDQSPSWTAGGQSVVAYDYGSQRLYLASGQGDAVRWITSDPWWPPCKPETREYSYAISLGDVLAFQSQEGEGYGREHRIVLRQLGADLRSTPIADVPMAWSYDSKFAWSPDGSMLAYHAPSTMLAITDHRGRELYRYFLPSEHRPQELGPAVSGQVSSEEVIFPERVKWSPNGERIAVVARNRDWDRWRIIVMSVDGADWVNVVEVQGADGAMGLSVPSWSPDGEYIYFAHYSEPDGIGQTLIYRVRPDGADLYQLGNLVRRTFIGAVKASPDGDTLLLVSRQQDTSGRSLVRRADAGGLYLMGVQGNDGPRQVREGDLWASWSPDGKRIAVYDPLHQPNNDALYTLHADGSPGLVLVRRDDYGRPKPADGLEVPPWESDIPHHPR